MTVAASTIPQISAKRQSFSEQVIKPIFGEIAWQEVGWLISPARHLTLLRSRRNELIRSRVRLVAALFALPTLLWSIIDYFAFPLDISRPLFIGRVIATLALVLVFFTCRGNPLSRRTFRPLWLLFAIPTLFYLYAEIYLGGHAFAGFAKAIAMTHAFLPFIIVVGICIFPLTAIEGFLLALPVLVVVALSGALHTPTHWMAVLGNLWLLLLTVMIALLASMSQLGFVIVLVRQALHDSLTGCFSRRSGEELLGLQFIISTRSGAPFSIAFIDVDNFKRINDEFGHDVGDRALVGAAHYIGQVTRTGDMLIRWGGEEFILAMPNTHHAQAEIVLKRLRETGFGMRPEGRPLTTSIGLAERITDQCGDWQALVQLADHRMYHAKQTGRDRVITCGNFAPAQQ